jgi:hypothetical protein
LWPAKRFYHSERTDLISITLAIQEDYKVACSSSLALSKNRGRDI